MMPVSEARSSTLSVNASEAHAAPVHAQYCRTDVLQLIPTSVGLVLSLGCGAGFTELALKTRTPACRIVGVDLDETMIDPQARGAFEQVVPGDLETLELPFSDGSFDALMYADVLEHLRDPQAALRRHRRLLRPGGWIIVSVPNLQHLSVFGNLLRGRWPEEDAGIFDRTHLRWFTRKTLLAMLEGAGYRVQRVHRNLRVFGMPQHRWQYYINQGLVRSHAWDILWWMKDFGTFQYLIVATPANGAR